MHRGYIKLWRKTFDSGIGREHATFALWMWILCNVTRKPLNYIARGEQIQLESGELIVGRKKLAMELRLSERSVRTCLQHLKSWGNLTIRSTNRFSILKVTNWETYQEVENQNDQQNDHEVTSKRPASDHKTRSREVKNVKKEPIGYPPDFESFWKAYPRKVKKDDALKAWEQRNGSRPPVEDLITKIEEFKKTAQWKKDNGEFIPHPGTWLRGGCWNDECKIEVKRSKPPTFEELEEMERNGL